MVTFSRNFCYFFVKGYFWGKWPSRIAGNSSSLQTLIVVIRYCPSFCLLVGLCPACTTTRKNGHRFWLNMNFVVFSCPLFCIWFCESVCQILSFFVHQQGNQVGFCREFCAVFFGKHVFFFVGSFIWIVCLVIVYQHLSVSWPPIHYMCNVWILECHLILSLFPGLERCDSSPRQWLINP